MPSKCYGLMRFKKVRATLLDECGAPVAGASSTVVTDGMISVDMSTETEDGDDYTQKNGNGDLCISESSPSRLKWATAGINFCKVDPELYNLLSGMPLIMDDATTPNAIGVSLNEDAWATGNAALEFWTDVAGQACGAGVGKSYGYFLLPWTHYGALDDFTLENASATFTINVQTHRDAQWGVGPYDVINTAAGDPSPLLVPVAPGDHWKMMLTTLAPPAAECGAQELTIPSP